MIYVFLGLVILVISFLIALLTLIREQRRQGKEQEKLLETESLVQEQAILSGPVLSSETKGIMYSENSGSGSLDRQAQNNSPVDITGHAEPFPWDQKPSEASPKPPSTLIEKSGDLRGNNLADGGEFVIPRSVSNKE